MKKTLVVQVLVDVEAGTQQGIDRAIKDLKKDGIHLDWMCVTYSVKAKPGARVRNTTTTEVDSVTEEKANEHMDD